MEAKILNDRKSLFEIICSYVFSQAQVRRNTDCPSAHRKLFTGIYSHAGRIRDYNITKKEWVLNGATVLYGSATELGATLNYDFSIAYQWSIQRHRETGH